MARLDTILRAVAAENADGLRLASGSPPVMIFGTSAGPMKLPPFTDRQMMEFVRELTTPADLAELHQDGSIELHYEYLDQLYSCTIEAGEGGGFRVDFEVRSPDDYTDSQYQQEVVQADHFGDIAIVDPVDYGGAGARGPAMGPLDGPAAKPPPFRPLDPQDGGLKDVGAPSMGSTPTRGSTRPAVSIHYTREEATAPPTFGDQLSQEAFHTLLRWMVEQQATDMHITPRFPPTLRVDNVFQPSQARQLSPEEVERLLYSILSPRERAHFEEESSVDLSYQVENLGRFRINVFRQMYGMSAAIRLISGSIGSLDELHLPPELLWITSQDTGLVLFTGPTGSGKSTTMAALIEQMNRTRQLHVLTLEAPIEYLFSNQKCLIQQREVGTHTKSFEQGLKDALRENPDVIMVGELRDYETVQMAMSASETGHLILATMHAATTNNAISRLIDVFPDSLKDGARAMISDVLTGVVNMRLLTHSSGRGLVPVVEMLKNNHAVAATIREGKMHQLRQVLSTSSTEGMWMFERYLANLFLRHEVSYEDAFRVAPDKRLFDQMVDTAKKVKAKARGK
ncbi:MAG: PilT/PilU family type 4a pilus ATPase [Deltaproteobacteria bacterium]|nr:PilT/PilU family type 4a pilus ATPase [Deltaproteobacteria bacterium]